MTVHMVGCWLAVYLRLGWSRYGMPSATSAQWLLRSGFFRNYTGGIQGGAVAFFLEKTSSTSWSADKQEDEKVTGVHQAMPLEQGTRLAKARFEHCDFSGSFVRSIGQVDGGAVSVVFVGDALGCFVTFLG
jgi:hypothetical protein